MSGILKYNVGIKAYSPIHIGSGNSYTASEYVTGYGKQGDEDVDTIKKINISKYFTSLSQEDRDRFISDLSNPNFNLKSFDNKIPNKYRIYTSINKCKELNPNREIEEAIKTMNEIYIPGTSLKGAIKTALLYNSISHEDIPEIIGKISNGKRLDFREYNNFINSIFSSNKWRNAAQGSIMKFLQVADSSTKKNPVLYDVGSIMAKDISSNFGSRGARNSSKSYWYKRGKSIVKSFLETIDRNSKLTTTITTNYDLNIYRRLNLKDKEDLIDIDFIKESIFEFSKAYIENEIIFSEKYEIDFLNKFYNNIKDKNTLSSPLLKIGAGSGFLATTIGLKVKEYDDYEFDEYFGKIRDMIRGTHPYEFPKSRKVTFKGGYPLGWIKLSFKEA